MVAKKYGRQGAPWEFNLRDVFRWCELLTRRQCGHFDPSKGIDMIYLQRFRCADDCKFLQKLLVLSCISECKYTKKNEADSRALRYVASAASVEKFGILFPYFASNFDTNCLASELLSTHRQFQHWIKLDRPVVFNQLSLLYIPLRTIDMNN